MVMQSHWPRWCCTDLVTASVASSAMFAGSARILVVVLRWRSEFSTAGRSATSEQCCSSHVRTVRHNSSMLAVETMLLYDVKSGCIITLKIQNFQFCSVRFLTYSSNISFSLLARCRETGAPVAGSCAWHTFMAWLRDSILLRNISASSCNCERSARNCTIYSPAFCNMAALLTLEFGF